MTRVLFFGPLGEMLGRGEAEIAVSYPRRLSALREAVEESFPELRNQPYSIAVDQVILDEASTVAEATEIALLPPFAGG